ncbi:MAG TPA: hypothetical protein P5262_04905 [Candidatus Moranbacteria bacterium]|nr:hypothetical protein [Candidatus Moranbacteria bacterium]
MRKLFFIILAVVGILVGLSTSVFAQDCVGSNPNWTMIGSPTVLANGVVLIHGTNPRVSDCRIEGKWFSPKGGQRQVVLTNCEGVVDVDARVNAAIEYAAQLTGPGSCQDRNCERKNF